MLKNNIFMLSFLIKYKLDYFIITIVNTFFNSFVRFFLLIYFIKNLFDLIENNSEFVEYIPLISTLIILYILQAIFNSYLNNIYYPKCQRTFQEKMQIYLYEKVKAIDYECYEYNKFYNNYIASLNEANKRCIAILNDLSGIIDNILFTILSMIVTIQIDILSVCMIFVYTFTSILLKNKRNKYEFDKYQELLSCVKVKNYVNQVFSLKNYAKELRLTNMKYLILGMNHKNYCENIRINNKYSNNLFFINVIRDNVQTSIVTIGLFGLLTYRLLVLKDISLGGFSAIISANWKLMASISILINHLVSFKQHAQYIELFKNFINYKNKVKNGMKPISKIYPSLIDIKNIEFTYESRLIPAINNITLQIKPKTKIAIVGLNGSGKTTFIKLLLHFYNVDKGIILFDNIDLKDIEKTSLYDNFNVIFQDFQIYAATLGENICMDCNDKDTSKKIMEILHNKEIFNEYISDINTQITKEFENNGLEFSGGEKQKLAILRAIYKNSPLVVFDELTSALDPLNEYHLNNEIFKSFVDQTIIIISHRLSTTKNADIIFVFDKGEIIESGTHAELMLSGGLYSKMFSIQYEQYSS